MQVQACKDKVSIHTSVKVITLTITQKSTTDFDASITDIVDGNDRFRCFNHRDKLDRTVQIGHGTHTRIACINITYPVLW